MMAVCGNKIVPVPLEEVAGVKNLVDPACDTVRSAKLVGMCFGD